MLEKISKPFVFMFTLSSSVRIVKWSSKAVMIEFYHDTFPTAGKAARCIQEPEF